MLSYRELRQRTDAPAGSSWGLFGPNDELGTLNFITPDCVREAAALVRKGSRFNLDLPLDAFDPPLFAHRARPRHLIFSNGRHHRDDYLDGFYLQASTQLDGLRHMRHPLFDFYNGVHESRIVPGDPSLGVNRLAEAGIVGRGLLLDLAGYLQARGRSIDHQSGEAFEVDLLQEVCDAQGCKPRPGDILMVRTGWLDHYFRRRSMDDRKDLSTRMRASGLVQSHRSLEWLWDHRLSVIAFDNVGVEALPSVGGSPFVIDDAQGQRISSGLMHPFLIGLMGFILGELWDLEALAEDCRRDGQWECMVVAKALNLVGGVGSPANATAIK